MAKLYPIEQDITNVNIGGWNNPQWIVIHFVGAAGQARDNANYFRNVYREASAHYFVDPHRIIQVVPDNRQGWHVGDGFNSGRGQFNGYHRYGATNRNSIGIEMCQDTSTGNNVWEWQPHAKTYEQVLLLTQYLQRKYNIPDERVIRHFDASGKSCPGCWMKNNWEKWHKFKRDLEALNQGELNFKEPKIKPKEKPTQPTQSKDMYTIQVGDTLSKIAKKFNVTVDELVKWNSIKDPNLIYPETRIIVNKAKEASKQGRFRFNTTVNVRNLPQATGHIPAKYYRDEIVYYDDYKDIDSMRWLKYTSYDGRTRWIAAGTKDKPYGEFIK